MALYFLCSVVLWPIIVWISPWPGAEALSPGIYLPQHDSQSYHVVAQKNGKLWLNCSVSSNVTAYGRLEVSWYKDGQQINFDNRLQLGQNGSLYFKRVLYRKRKNITDAGLYECHVKNKIGSIIAKRVNLKIASIHKSYTRQPKPQTVPVGGVARFECQIKAEPPPLYTWLKDEKEQITANNRFIIISTGILQILNVSKEDEGSYSCSSTPGGLHNLPDQVENIKWHRSDEAPLTVDTNVGPRDPVIVAPPQNAEVELGQMVVLECLVDGEPKPTITWERGSGKPLNSKSSMLGGNLKLLETSEDDSDLYICRVKSPGITDVTAKAQVTVLTRPILTLKPQSFEYPAARTARFRCRADGVPTPKISWYKDGQPIESLNLRTKIDNDALVVRNTARENSGYYQCVASNSVNYATAFARLNITVAENRPEAPRNIQVRVIGKDKIQISWTPSSYRACCPVLAYTVDIAKTNGDSSNNYVVQGVTTKLVDGLDPYTNYSLWVQAFSEIGSSEKSQVITVQTEEAEPDMPPVIRLASTTPTSILIEWDELPVKYRNGVIIGYKIYYMQEGLRTMKIDDAPGSARSHMITGLEPATTYKVRVLAGTSAGFSHFDNKKWPWVDFTTPGMGKSLLNLTVPETPMDLAIVPISATSVNVTWSHHRMSSNPVQSYTLVYKEIGNPSGQQKSRVIQIPNPNTSVYTVSNLVRNTNYEFSLVANNEYGSSGPVVEEYFTSEDPLPPAPRDVHVINKTSTTLLLSWMQLNSSVQIDQFEVRYHPWIFDKDKQYNRILQRNSSTVGVRITTLKPYTHYQIDVRALSRRGRWSKWSKPIIDGTLEDLPSEPREVKAVLTENGIEVQWKPPAQPNGNITTYILEYQIVVKSQHSDGWKILRINGSATSLKLEEKVNGKLTVRIRACTSAGSGPFTTVVEMDSITAGPSVKEWNPWDQRLGIIVGVVIGVLCIIICVIIIMLRNKCVSNNYPQTQRAHYHGNGHVPRRSNGHVMDGTGVNSFQLETMTPMLTREGENEHSDSKGCGSGNLIVTPNGTKINGYVPFKNGMRNAHISNGHISSYNYRDNAYPEERCGLIAAMLTGSDRSQTTEEPLSTSKTPDKDSLLDGIDHSVESSLDGEGGEQVPHQQLPQAIPDYRGDLDLQNLNTSQPHNPVDSSPSAHNKAAVAGGIDHTLPAHQENVEGRNTSAPSPLLRKTHSSCSNQLSTSLNGHLSDDAPCVDNARTPSGKEPAHPNTNSDNLRDTSLPQELYKTPAKETSFLQHDNLSGNLKNGVRSNGLKLTNQLPETSEGCEQELVSSCQTQGVPMYCHNDIHQPQATTSAFNSQNFERQRLLLSSPQENKGKRFQSVPWQEVNI